MRLTGLLLACGLLSVGASACGRSNPAAPGQVGATITGLAISGPDAVLTGLSAVYSATATGSDGTTRTVTPTWTSSDLTVAGIEAGGRLDGRTHGSTSVTASFEGRSASKTVQVVNNYAGTWIGSYVIRACTASGDLTDHDGGWCVAGPGRVGSVINGTVMKLAQSGANLGEISGTFGSFEEPVTGEVTPDGRLRLGGTFSEWDWEHEFVLATWQIRAWDANLTGPDAMAGRRSEHMVSLYFRRGEADMDEEIITMTRTSAQSSPFRRGAARH